MALVNDDMAVGAGYAVPLQCHQLDQVVSPDRDIQLWHRIQNLFPQDVGIYDQQCAVGLRKLNASRDGRLCYRVCRATAKRHDHTPAEIGNTCR